MTLQQLKEEAVQDFMVYCANFDFQYSSEYQSAEKKLNEVINTLVTKAYEEGKREIYIDKKVAETRDEVIKEVKQLLDSFTDCGDVCATEEGCFGCLYKDVFMRKLDKMSKEDK